LVNATVEVELMRALLLVIFSLFTIISVWSLYQEKWVFHVGIALVILNSSTAGVALLFHIRMLELFATISATMFSILSCFIAGRHVFNWRDTNANSLIGAICVYLLLGVIWALVYGVLAFLWPQGTFQGLVVDGKSMQFDNILYFSFVTLTTAGYGDITCLNPLFRTVAYLEMLTGQFYMAILVSSLVANFIGLRKTR